MKSDRCPEAIPKFLSSQQLDPSAGTLVNLATCYARVGRTAAACRVYRQSAALADSEKNDSLKERASHAVAVLMPSVTKLRVVAPRNAAAMSLTLNGEPLTVDNGLPIPLDPGENIIEAAAPGRRPWRRSVSATEIGATIVIEVPELPAAERPLEPRPRTPADRPTSSGADLRVPAVIVGGLGLSSIVGGAILGLSAKATYDESNDHCLNGRCTLEGHDLRVDAMNKARLSTYAIGFGTAVAASGVVLWLLSPSRPKPNVELSPWIPGESSAWGVSVGGSM